MTLNEYFDFLKGKVLYPEDEENQFDNFLNYLINFPFASDIPHDENRVRECADERVKWVNQEEVYACPISVFEILLSLAVHMEFIVDSMYISVANFFWELCMNMFFDVIEEREDLANLSFLEVNSVLTAFVERKYNRQGRPGCPFLLNLSNSRKVRKWPLTELWYQMQTYLRVNY